MNLIKYWKVYHTPDTTESGVCMNVLYVKTEWKGFPAQQSCEKEILEDFCYKNFGPKVDYVQGVAPTTAWHVHVSDKYFYDNPEPVLMFPYYTPKKIELEIGLKNGEIKLK